MELFPAIDLLGGACVRLKQGDFAQSTVYEQDPLAAAEGFAQEGARWLHVVDLDGAKDGAARQTDLIAQLAQKTSLNLQVGGGLRSEGDIETLLRAGARRVVIGSIAVQDPATTRGWLARFGGEKIILALDLRLDEKGVPEVLTRGWQEGSRQSLWDLLAVYEGSGLRTFLCTDVARDGMMAGPNLDLYRAIRARFPRLDLLASGGIGQLDDLRALAKLGASGAIVGKALYEKRFTLRQALHAR